jgi:non-ribosomal peptide synthetase component F
LESIGANPDMPVGELTLLSPAERQQLLVDWNPTATQHPGGECIHHLFEDQALRTPDMVALVAGKQSMTYRELNQRANRLAHLLQSLEAGPDVLIGIYLERSCELAVALLAVLKAGSAYVPMDPNYPNERISFMIADSKMPLLLTQSELTDRLPPVAGQVVCIDHVLGHTGRLSEQNPVTAVSAENLACLIYTSGSTGRPKGVAIEHRSVIALVHWAGQVFKPEELAGVLASTSICFDLSIFELFVTSVVAER